MGVGVPDVVVRVRHRKKAVGRVLQQRVVIGPVIATGVVQAHAHPGVEHGTAQIADDIAAGLIAALARVFQLGGPEAEPIVVLGGQHHVTRAGIAADRRDRIHVRISGAAVEGSDEVVIGGVGAVGVALMTPGGAALQPTAVEVPLGIGVVPQHLRGTRCFEQLLDVRHLGCPTGHRVQTPVQEDSQFGVVVPVR